MNILVTGANGQLGQEFKYLYKTYAEHNFQFMTKKDVDFNNLDSIKRYFADKRFDIVINCAAYTAVDLAEDEVVAVDAINHLAVEALAKISKEMSFGLVHVSTDYVYEGVAYRPYIEDDIANPNNVYGKSKRDGELAILKQNLTNSIIIRTSWLYSSYGNNFFKTMLRLGKDRESMNVVYDQVGTPTYASDLAHAILNIIPQLANDKTEIYHYSNEGVSSWYDFAEAIFDIFDINCNIKAITTNEYPTRARRPYYSVLNKSKIKRNFNIEIRHWKKSLKECKKRMDEEGVLL